MHSGWMESEDEASMAVHPGPEGVQLNMVAVRHAPQVTAVLVNLVNQGEAASADPEQEQEDPKDVSESLMDSGLAGWVDPEGGIPVDRA